MGADENIDTGAWVDCEIGGRGPATSTCQRLVEAAAITCTALLLCVIFGPMVMIALTTEVDGRPELVRTHTVFCVERTIAMHGIPVDAFLSTCQAVEAYVCSTRFLINRPYVYRSKFIEWSVRTHSFGLPVSPTIDERIEHCVM